MIFKYFLLAIPLFSATSVMCQANSFYWPDGSPFITKENNIISHRDSCEAWTSHAFYFNKTVVFYFALSNVPAYILSDYAKEIPQAIRAYRHLDYLSSKQFKDDIAEYISQGLLDTAYTRWSLGNPDHKTKTDGSMAWTYNRHDLTIFFKDTIAYAHQFFPFRASAKHGIAIKNFRITGDEIFTGFDVTLLNTGKKRIKYAWFTLTAYNPVDDIIGSKTVQGVGPVEPGESGSWQFSNCIVSKVFDYAKITGVKVQYFDGTTKLLTASETLSVFFKD